VIAVPNVLALLVGAGIAMRRRVSKVSRIARVAQLISVAGVVACPMVAVVQLALSPGGAFARPVLGTLMAAVFAAESGRYLWLVLRRPGLLGAWRDAGVLGLAAALAVAFALFDANQAHGQSGDFRVTGAVELVMILSPLTAGVLAVLVHVVQRNGIGRGLRSGAAECLWAVLLSPPAAFIVDLLTTRDDLGRATVILTRISMVVLVVSLVAKRLRVRAKPWPGPSEAMAS
jgi:hypothetical protein